MSTIIYSQDDLLSFRPIGKSKPIIIGSPNIWDCCWDNNILELQSLLVSWEEGGGVYVDERNSSGLTPLHIAGKPFEEKNC